jgi:hypothetical protein
LLLKPFNKSNFENNKPIIKYYDEQAQHRKNTQQPDGKTITISEKPTDANDLHK